MEKIKIEFPQSLCLWDNKGERMGRMETGKKLQVMYEDRLVGTLALTANHKVAFEYDDAWLEEGFSISPFSLPLKKQVFIPNKDYFEGLFGVFADSLPDAWGRLLLRRLLLAHKQQPDDWTVLDRLAVVRAVVLGVCLLS